MTKLSGMLFVVSVRVQTVKQSARSTWLRIIQTWLSCEICLISSPFMWSLTKETPHNQVDGIYIHTYIHVKVHVCNKLIHVRVCNVKCLESADEHELQIHALWKHFYQSVCHILFMHMIQMWWLHHDCQWQITGGHVYRLAKYYKIRTFSLSHMICYNFS